MFLLLLSQGAVSGCVVVMTGFYPSMRYYQQCSEESTVSLLECLEGCLPLLEEKSC